MAATSRTYSKDERATICAKIFVRIAAGQKVSASCQAEGIHWNMLWEWKGADPELGALYARAIKASGTSWADRATQAVESANVKTVQLAKLRADHYVWRASRADRRGFGDHIGIEVDGEGLRPSVVVLPALDAPPKPPPDGLLIEETHSVRIESRSQPALAAALGDYMARRNGHAENVTETASE